ncbi:protein LEG1 homolog [Mobula hypostoma]|uniref:protein LEG1 homolog n=1 Tax=Mobula hypostoma TaxID=723540 RepID=UPI002FC34884
MARFTLACETFAFVLLTSLLTNNLAAHRQERDRGNSNYPPLWDDVPDSLAGFVSIRNKTVVNPWNYLERMGMYKILLSVTAKYMSNFGPSNTGNVLWGLPLQHGWQFITGRLADPSNVSSCGQKFGDSLCISTRSWWSCMNYYLATIPFLGAVEAGFFEDWPFEIKILPPEEYMDKFCYTAAGCHAQNPEMMSKWTTLFQLLKKSKEFSQIKLLPEEDDIWQHLWIAHVASIEAALPKFSDRLADISAPEAEFGVSWANAVEFIAATHFPTNFNQTNTFQAFLPPRMLSAGDKAPSIPDLSKEQNRALVALDILNKGNKLTGGWCDWLLRVWRRAMCSEDGRAQGQNLLENIVVDPDRISTGIRSLLLEYIKNRNCIIINS